MMTQDRSTGQPLAAPVLSGGTKTLDRPPDVIVTPSIAPTSASSTTELQSPEAPQVSPRNLNPAAPAFHQLAPTSPKNLNPSAPVFRQSQSSEQPASESTDTAAYPAVAPAAQQGSGGSDAGGEGDAPSLPNGGIEGLTLEDKPGIGMEDPVTTVSDGLARGEGEESPNEQQQYQYTDQGDDHTEYIYPEELLAPVTKQMHYYFSSENLPNDKFLNGHMDSDKYIPLDLFLDFGRIKPICSSLDMLAQAVEASSYLELNETKDKVRVSQCRKTLTLRGFPGAPPVTEEAMRKFVLDIGAEMPTRIELVMVKDKLSTWYVTFRDMSAALNSFSMFHNKQAVFKGHNIGCCIKSSGTLGGSGYYPTATSSGAVEEQHHSHPHQQPRRMVPHTQASAASGISTVTVTAPVPAHTVVPSTPSPMPQQPQQQQHHHHHHQQLQQQAAAAAAAAAALLPQYQAMQLHPSFVSGSPTSIYYPQTSPSYMQYMPGILPQGWPGAAAAMDPGIIMQSNGLQPQQIRSTPMPRPQIMPSGPGGQQHRFTRPQRVNRPNNSIDRSNSERGNDRQAPVVSVANLAGARSSPSTNANYMLHNQHQPQHHHHQQHHRGGNSGANVREDVVSAVMSVSAVPQVASAHHHQQQQQQQQYVPPLVSQHQLQQQQPHASISTTTGTPSMEAPQYQHHHGQQPGSNTGGGQQTMLVQGATGSSSSTSSSAGVPGLPHHATGGGSGGSGIGQSQMQQHPLSHHHNQQHHHSQPPPPLPHQQNQQTAQPSQHHHQHHPQHHAHHQQHHHPNQQHQQQHHHHHQGQQHHHQQHHHHQQQHPHLLHNQHQPPQQNHHHPGNHHHHHHQQQQHHNMMQQPPPLHSQHIHAPPPPHHPHHQHQALQGNRPDRKPRRRREDMGRNQRVERAHRANFSSQVPPVADNFTMEANSFPPLPGAANNVANSEVSHENRLSDVVRGLPRTQGGTTSVGSNSGLGGPIAVGGGGPRGPSSSPSPVPTPGLSTPSAQSNHHGHHSQQRGLSNQQADSDTSGALDDADTASSSQEDADVDAAAGDISVVLPVSSDSRMNAGVKTEMGSPLEPHPHVGMSRPYKVSASTNGAAGGSRSSEPRHGPTSSTVSSGMPNHQGARGPQPAVQSPLLSPTAVATVEAPKPSYAQIAQKTANTVIVSSGTDPVPVGAAAMHTPQSGQTPLTSSSNTSTAPPSAAVPAQNGPSASVSSQQLSGNPMSTSARSNSGGTYNQSPNHSYQRDYRPGQHRAGSGAATKDGNFQGGPLYQRPPNANNNNNVNNRRNGKDKLPPNNMNNKFDRRKPEARQK
ncbi:hypothetical protein EGW08_013854 [Elysia chlorotica]|uniref:HTH La-type RNA-binding domain-containing protein n=1 Tax=Elysia chlorotica TaxID=188477 RepID=A0A433T9W0_ELYCH|nr:hypothetical protein EGW08_013854 [Elysia chlorotica]